MSCPHCGRDVPDFAATCPGCGHAAVDDTIRFVPNDPAKAYSDPQHYLLANSGVPATSWAQPEPVAVAVPRRRLLAILIGALALLLVVSGVAVAGGYLGWYGGGKRPSDMLPGSAVAYLQVDLDPSLAQKASAWQFLRDLLEVKDAVAAGQPDPKAVLWKLMASQNDELAAVDYVADIAPWLGNRIGLAVLNRDSQPVVVVAIQVTDAERAATQLAKGSGTAGTDYQVTIRDGYALLTQPATTSFVLDELAKGTLAANPSFTKDFATLGEPGIVAGWADLHGLAAATPGSANSAVSGSGIFALRFTADTLEVAAKLHGLGESAVSGRADLGELPSSTWAAIGFSGGGATLARQWPSLPKEAAKALAEAGLEEADLAAVLGRSLTLGLSSPNAEYEGVARTPSVGLVVASDDVGRAQRTLRTLAAAASGPPAGEVPVYDRVDGDILTAASTEAYLAELSSGKTRLATADSFIKALPDHDRASVSAYLSVPPVLANLGLASDDEHDRFLKALRAVGSQYVDEGSGAGSWLLRVVRS